MATVSEIVSEAAASPYFGAARLIRRVDPFWQTEIGEERSWEAKFVDVYLERCGCPTCTGCREQRGKARYVIVEATTAKEAADKALLDIQNFEEFEGVRLFGSGVSFVEPGDA